MTRSEVWRADAYHECAHALVATVSGIAVDRVWIARASGPMMQDGGMRAAVPLSSVTASNRECLLGHLRVSCAGALGSARARRLDAEEADELRAAIEAAVLGESKQRPRRRLLLREAGVSPGDIAAGRRSLMLLQLDGEEARKAVRDAIAAIEQTLESNAGPLDALAQALLRDGELNGQAINVILTDSGLEVPARSIPADDASGSA